MATISAGGIGSGLDTASIISQLMSIERQPITALTKQVSSFQSKLSALGQLKGGLSALQTAAEALSKTDKFSAFKATVADSTLFSAAAGTTATAGSYAVQVKYLAQAHKLASAGFASNSATVNTGTLTIELGQLTGGAGGTYTADASKTLSITVDGTNNTLEGVRNAINAAKKGVTATIVNDGSASPARLVITSNNSGTANTIRMSGITGLDYDPVANTGAMEQKIQSQDAQLEIDGIAITRSTNTVSDAIPGVTLNLTKTNLGSTTTLTVASDQDTVKSNIQAFVKAYNDLNSMIKTQTAFDANTKTAGALNGDSTVRTVASRMRSVINESVSGLSSGFSRLADVGISFQADGSLKLDSSKLDTALSDPTKDVSAIFGDAAGTSGVAADIVSMSKSMLGTGGLLSNRTDGINATIRRLNDRKDSLEVRMTKIESRLQAQFTALDTTMSSMNATSQYLTQQLASLSANR
ncbi:MAG TPA: flagellar filament capping protein FliD [Aromatoleum sp.]|uniref:flagellar filament capping protein FliD n=1 Tax=Aromatoleum sp. TaxID=2307007 RepID=UPI002B49CFE4|nr:flagellar filament capping protein FliD [Aromatoleum sp.]HJV26685.1 flagellar filament capping protein FliD [Aromatoleum sp.]